MDPADTGRGMLGRSPLTEDDRGQERRGGREPADGIPAPATVLIDTGHRQRMQRLHQQGPQPRNRRGQVPAHPPGHTGRPEKAIICGIFRHTGHIRSRRALERDRPRPHTDPPSPGAPGTRPGLRDSGQLTADNRTERHASQTNQLLRFRGELVIAATVRLSMSGLAGDPQPTHLLTRIGGNGCSSWMADHRSGRRLRPSAPALDHDWLVRDRRRRCANPRRGSLASARPGSRVFAGWLPAAPLSPHAARAAAAATPRASQP